MESKKRIQITTDVPRKVKRTLEKLAEKQGCSLAGYVRLQLILHVERAVARDAQPSQN
jgi:hypothetical protein